MKLYSKTKQRTFTSHMFYKAAGARARNGRLFPKTKCAAVALLLIVGVFNYLRFWKGPIIIKPTLHQSTSSTLLKKQNVDRVKQHVNTPQRQYPEGDTEIDKLQLFLPGFPGGFDEMRSTFIKSLEFFWPREKIDLVVILDDTVYRNYTDRDEMTANVKSFFNSQLQDKVSIAYNPRSDNARFGRGWCIQQLIMFWADNFTDSEFIGFVDDDTLFSKAIQPEDIFDSMGRPHVIVKYNTAIDDPNHLGYIKNWMKQSHFALGIPAYVNAMAAFPVVIKRNHLPLIREAVLTANPSYDCFDDFFVEMVTRGMFSQFAIMFQYLWLHHRDEYNWHFEADTYEDTPFFPNGYPIGSVAAARLSYMSAGSPAENGVTAEMLRPFPRVAIHGSYVTPEAAKKNRAISFLRRGYSFVTGRAWRDENAPAAIMLKNMQRENLVSSVLRRGYCFSQPLLLHKDGATNDKLLFDSPELDRRCRVYNVSTSVNLENEWMFEMFPIFNQWSSYDADGVHRAHFARVRKNRAHDWDLKQVGELFD
jgi:hypothetical protein